MSASENRRSSLTVADGPDDPADRDGGREQPEAEWVHPETLAGIQDEDCPRRAVGDIERDDRQGQRPNRRVRGEPSDAFGHLRSQVPPVTDSIDSGVGDVRHDARDEPRSEREAGGSGRER